MSLRGWMRALLALPVVAVLSGVCVLAVVLGRAGNVAFDTDLALRGASARANVQTGQFYGEVIEASNDVPWDPSLHELIAWIDVRKPSPQSEDATVHLARALELRPVSPYTWAALANEQYRQGDLGGRFQRAIVNAALLGPREPGVQTTVVDVGLASLDRLEPAGRAAVEGMLANGMRRSPVAMLQIAERRGRLRTACSYLSGLPRQVDSKWTQTCNSLEAKS